MRAFYLLNLLSESGACQPLLKTTLLVQLSTLLVSRGVCWWSDLTTASNQFRGKINSMLTELTPCDLTLGSGGGGHNAEAAVTLTTARPIPSLTALASVAAGTNCTLILANHLAVGLADP